MNKLKVADFVKSMQEKNTTPIYDNLTLKAFTILDQATESVEDGWVVLNGVRFPKNLETKVISYRSQLSYQDLQIIDRVYEELLASGSIAIECVF